MAEKYGQEVDYDPFTDTDVVFKNVRFGVAPQYQAADGSLPTVMLVDIENEDGDLREDQIITIGKGFVVVDGGSAVTHVNRKHNRGLTDGFGRGSKAQALLDSLAEVDVDQLIEHGEATSTGPRFAAFWENLTGRYDKDVKEFTTKGGETKTYDVPKFTALYGWSGLEGRAAEAEAEVAPAPAKAVKAAAKKAAAKKPSGVSAEIVEQLVALAQKSEDFDDFIIAAYDLSIIGEPGVAELVDDEANGIWSQR